MSIQLVIGRAGTGKTRHCFNKVIELCQKDPLGPPVWWIVPRQMTFLVERMLACESGLAGVCRVRVVSFDRLVEQVLSEVGGTSAPRVSTVGRQMVIGRLLRREQKRLRFFRASARQSGLPGELERTFAEFERCGIDPQMVANQFVAPTGKGGDDDNTQKAPGGNGDNNGNNRNALADKLHDLSLLYDAYHEFIGTERLDPHKRRLKVLESMRACPSLLGSHCFIDGIHDFTAFEQQAIAVLAGVCRSVVVTLLLDPKLARSDAMPGDDDVSTVFRRTQRSHARLQRTLREAGIKPSDPLVLNTAHRHAASAALRAIEASWDQRRPTPQSRHDGIELHEADDLRDEVDAAARAIRRLTADRLRYRQIAVLVRNVDHYAELVQSSFRRHGIPLFIDRRRTAEHHPLVQLVRSALRCATVGFPLDAVLTVARSGLVGLTPTDGDLLENYYLEHRLRPECWTQEPDWSFSVRRLHRREDGEDEFVEQRFEPRTVNDLRRNLVAGLQPLLDVMATPNATVSQRVAGLLKMLDACAVRKTMTQWIEAADRSGEFEHRDEHLQVWTEFVELIDQLVDLLGDEELSPQEFVEVLDYGFEQFDLAITPPTVDEVLVGDVDRTRTPEVQAVLMLGMNDGDFPATPSEGTVFPDRERRVLDDLGLTLEPDTACRLLDETFLAYAAMARPSRRLLLFRACSDESGRPTTPSLYWRKVRALFPGLSPQRDATPIGIADDVVRRVLRWVRSEDATRRPPMDELSASLYQRLVQLRKGAPEDMQTVVSLANDAWRALTDRSAEKLSPAVANELLHSPLRTSVSQVETFASCPFQYFARYTLALEPTPDDEVTPLDLGNVFHAAMERIVRRYIEKNRDFAGDDAHVLREVSVEANASAHLAREQVMLDNARGRFLLRRVKQALLETVITQREIARRGRFRPAAVEVQFGEDKPLPAITIDVGGGKKIVLEGKIDRIDLLDDATAFAVIDYKLRGKELKLDEVYHGLALQLLAYLAVVGDATEVAGRPLNNPNPAAALFVALQRTQKKAASSAEPKALLKALLKTKPCGVINADFVPVLDAGLQPGSRSEILNVQWVKKDNSLKGDVVDPQQLGQLIAWVRRQLRGLGRQILDGVIQPRPYLTASGRTPCSWCDYRAVCRFESNAGPYRWLEKLDDKQALDAIAKGLANEQGC